MGAGEGPPVTEGEMAGGAGERGGAGMFRFCSQ